MIIKVFMILLLAGAPPMIGENGREKFDTVEACEKALPRLEKEAVTAFKKSKPPMTRGKDYEFKLKCLDTTPKAPAAEKI